MRFLILSDIHANAQALDAVLADADRRGYDQVLLLGDVVGYGADPAAVIERIRTLHPLAAIRGNHDKVCCGIDLPFGFNETARRSVEWTMGTLTETDRAWLKALTKGPVCVDEQIEICHGAPSDEDLYVFEARDAERAMRALQRPVGLFCHTHVPAAYVRERRSNVAAWDRAVVELPPQGIVFVNVGAVGQPRDGNPLAAYGVLDTGAARIERYRVPYDVAEAQRRIRDAGLPAWLADRLELGR